MTDPNSLAREDKVRADIKSAMAEWEYEIDTYTIRDKEQIRTITIVAKCDLLQQTRLPLEEGE